MKEIYSNWLNEPFKINSDDAIIIKELIDNYPFCTTSRLLYLKSLQNTNNINYNYNLKKTAAYSPDRKRLFYFLTQNKVNLNKRVLNTTDTINTKLITKKNIIKRLSIGQPLEFQKEEKYSFNEWLKLSQVKPINRVKETENQFQKKVSLIEDFIANRNRKIKGTDLTDTLDKYAQTGKEYTKILEQIIKQYQISL